MQRKFTSGSRQAPDPFDQYLEKHNYFRKHTARDSSSLFRVISEQMYDTQLYHMDIREKCVEFMAKKRKLFNILVQQNLDEYLDELAKPKTHGTLIELQAIGEMYKRNVVLFEPFNLGNCLNYRDYKSREIFRVFYTPEHHFDSIFTADYITDAAICQSICYEILYKQIFKLPDVGFAVEEMLHASSLEEGIIHSDYYNEGYCKNIYHSDGRVFSMDLPHNTNCILENYEWCHFHCDNFLRISTNLQHELVYYQNSHKYHNNDANYIMSLNRTADALLPNKYVSCVRQLLKEGITPFPYKVAKALDANMYRNIEFDAWNETRKENKYNAWYHGDNNFKVGAKCYVRLNESDEELYTCHIQEMTNDNLFCLVFVERLGEKRMVPYDSLSPMAPEDFKPWTMPYNLYRQMHRYKYRFARPVNYSRTCSSAYIKCEREVRCKSMHAIEAPYYTQSKTSNIETCKSLRHLLHLDNFPGQAIDYRTMPLSINHDVQDIIQDTNQQQQQQQQQQQPVHQDINNAQVPNGLTDSAVVHYNCNEQMVNETESNEQQVNVPSNANVSVGTGYAPQLVPYSPYYADDYRVYYGNNSAQTVTTGYANGGMVYFMNGAGLPVQPSYGSNMYTVAPPQAGGIPYVGAPTYFADQEANKPFDNETNDVTVDNGNTNDLRVDNGGGDAGQMNAEVGNSPSAMQYPEGVDANADYSYNSLGEDLPTDVVTLRYFYNLGIEYNNKLSLNNQVRTGRPQNVETGEISQVIDNMRNMVLDGNGNVQEADVNNNTDTASNAFVPDSASSQELSVSTLTMVNCQQPDDNKNTTAYRNTNKIKDNNNNNIIVSPVGDQSAATSNNHDSGYNNSQPNGNNYHRGGNSGSGNRRPNNNNAREFHKERYNNSRYNNSDAFGVSHYNYRSGGGGGPNSSYEQNAGKYSYRNPTYYSHNHNIAFSHKKSNNYVINQNNAHAANSHHTPTPTSSAGAVSMTNENYGGSATQSPNVNNTPAVVDQATLHHGSNNIVTGNVTPSMPDAAYAVPPNYAPMATAHVPLNYGASYNEYMPPAVPQGAYCVYTVPPPQVQSGANGPPALITPQGVNGFYYGRNAYYREDTDPAVLECAPHPNIGPVMPYYGFPPNAVYYAPTPQQQQPPLPPALVPSNGLLPTPNSAPLQNYWSMPPPTINSHGHPPSTRTMNTMHPLNASPNMLLLQQQQQQQRQPPPPSPHLYCAPNNNNQYMARGTPKPMLPSSMKTTHRREKAS